MRRLIKNIVYAAMALAFSGCTAIPVPPEDAPVQIKSEEAFIGNKMLIAMTTGNYSDFSHDFSMELKESVKENVYLKIKSDLAARKEVLAQWRLLDTLDRGGIYTTEVWKVVIAKQTKNGKNNSDRLFYVTTAKLDGKPQVIGFKFDPLF